MSPKTKILAVLFLCLIIITISALAWNMSKKQDHLPLYEDIVAIKNKLLVNITDADFPETGIRECIFFELREEDSEDYFQTTVDYWVFQAGQGMDGDIEAWVEIYNKPDNSTAFIVEVARFCWYELTVSYDGIEKCFFPKITNDTVSLGYCTFQVVP